MWYFVEISGPGQSISIEIEADSMGDAVRIGEDEMRRKLPLFVIREIAVQPMLDPDWRQHRHDLAAD